MLNLSDAYSAMPDWANRTLFRICSAHCDTFDPYEEVLPQEASSYMIGTIKERFNILGTKSMAVDHEKIVVCRSLKYDFYNFEVSCIQRLKNRAKPLYVAFCSLIEAIGFQRSEADTCCFYREFIYSQMEYEGERKAYIKALEHYEKGERVYLEIKDTAIGPERALEGLYAYREKKEVYLEIVRFLKKWIGTRFFFIDSAPYQFYREGEDHDKMDEHCEIAHRIGFHTTKGASFNAFLTDENQNRYNNQVLCEPCFTVTQEHTGQALEDNIDAFEDFSKELIEVLDLIETSKL